MNSTTIASASVLPDGQLALLVEAGIAQSFYNHLTALGVRCTEPSPVIWRPRRVTRDAMGRLNVEEDVLESEIIATGTAQDFTNWMVAWVTTNKA